MTKITTLLFDCDNTLVLSEELAFEACAELANEILASRDIPDRYTGPQLLGEFVGQNFRGMMVSLKAKYKYEMSDTELETYVTREEDAVIAKLKAKLRPCEGVEAELEKLEKHGKYHLAVVSSSALRRVQASINKVGQDKYFEGEHVFSATSSNPTSGHYPCSTVPSSISSPYVGWDNGIPRWKPRMDIIYTTSSNNGSSSGLSQSDKIELGVGLGMGIPQILLALITLIVMWPAARRQ
ncbi:HAD superfamily hydrolase [Hyaloscypha variabilis]